MRKVGEKVGKKEWCSCWWQSQPIRSCYYSNIGLWHEHSRMRTGVWEQAINTSKDRLGSMALAARGRGCRVASGKQAMELPVESLIHAKAKASTAVQLLFSWILTDYKNGDAQHLWATCTTALFSWWKRLSSATQSLSDFNLRQFLSFHCAPLWRARHHLLVFWGELLLDSITSVSSPGPTRAASPPRVGVPALDHPSSPHFTLPCAGGLSQVHAFSSSVVLLTPASRGKFLLGTGLCMCTCWISGGSCWCILPVYVPFKYWEISRLEVKC